MHTSGLYSSLPTVAKTPSLGVNRNCCHVGVFLVHHEMIVIGIAFYRVPIHLFLLHGSQLLAPQGLVLP